MRPQLWKFERRAHAMGYEVVAGVDEVGMGPLAGPVVAGAVVLRLGDRILGLNDSKLMTAELMATLCDHALGTYRVMTTVASELLAAAAQRELPQLDEKLYFELFAAPRAAAVPAAPARPASARRSR